MTSEELIKIIESVDWLSNCNHIGTVLNSDYRRDWLPTSRDQENPFAIGLPDDERKKDEAKNWNG